MARVEIDGLRLEEIVSLVGPAIERLMAGEDDEAEALVAAVGEQAPELLAPYAEVLVALPIAGHRQFAIHAFRAMSDSSIARLEAQLSEQGPSAWIAALAATRRPDVLRRLCERYSWFGSWDVMESGFLPETLAPLFVDAPLHVAFAKPPPLADEHPTWVAASEHAKTRFGGLAQGVCGDCHGELHHLLTLDPVPPALAKLCALPRLELAVCLSCIFDQNGVGGASFEHDDAGRPSQPRRERRLEPSFPVSAPLLPMQVDLVDLGARWVRQSWRRTIGNLNRVGGAPSWIQDPHYPECPGCGRHMPFVAQLDSPLESADGTHFHWGNGGILYVHYCDPCRRSLLHMQNS